MLIVFEGIDGTGKTSIAKLVAKKANGIYIKTPPKEYENWRAVIHSSKNPYTRFLYYLSSVIFLSEKVNNIRNESVLVCDRYYYTSIADFFYQSKIMLKDLKFWRELMSEVCCRPDMIFLCKCKRKERLKRMQKRHVKTVADDVSEDFQDQMSIAFNYILPEEITIILDTTNKTIEVLGDIVIQYLSKTEYKAQI